MFIEAKEKVDAAEADAALAQVSQDCQPTAVEQSQGDGEAVEAPLSAAVASS